MKWLYPKNMFIVMDNNGKRAVWKADQDTLEEMVKVNAIKEYISLKVLNIRG